MLKNFISDFLKNRNLEKKIVDAEMSIKIGKLPPKSGELAALGSRGAGPQVDPRKFTRKYQYA
jgi:hypothetical protein